MGVGSCVIQKRLPRHSRLEAEQVAEVEPRVKRGPEAPGGGLRRATQHRQGGRSTGNAQLCSCYHTQRKDGIVSHVVRPVSDLFLSFGSSVSEDHDQLLRV